MGGQACVFYGAAEFSRDCDIVNRDEPTEARVRFWLRESRTPEMLIRVAAENPEITQQMIPVRPLLTETLAASRMALAAELEKERVAEMEADQAYWRPLIRELEVSVPVVNDGADRLLRKTAMNGRAQCRGRRGRSAGSVSAPWRRT